MVKQLSRFNSSTVTESKVRGVLGFDVGQVCGGYSCETLDVLPAVCQMAMGQNPGTPVNIPM